MFEISQDLFQILVQAGQNLFYVIISLFAPIVVYAYQHRSLIKLYRRRWIRELCEVNSSIKEYYNLINKKPFNLKQDILAIFCGFVYSWIFLVLISLKVDSTIFAVVLISLIIVSVVTSNLLYYRIVKQTNIKKNNKNMDDLKSSIQKISMIDSYIVGVFIWLAFFAVFIWAFLIRHLNSIASKVVEVLITVAIWFILTILPLLIISYIKLKSHNKLKELKSKYYSNLKESYAKKLPEIIVYTSSEKFEGKIKDFKKDYIVLETNDRVITIPWENVKAIEFDKSVFSEEQETT